jgi:hypothetical protein
MKFTTKTVLHSVLALGLIGASPLAIAQKSGEVAFGSTEPGKRLTGTVSVRGGWDDNSFATPTNEVDSFFTSAVGQLAYDIGDERTRLALGLSGRTAYYYDRGDDPWDFNITGTANFFHNLSERVDIFASTSLTYAVEPDLGTVFITDRRDGDYFISNTNAGFSYQWTQRFSTVTSADFTSVFYSDDAIGDFYNRVEYGGSQSFRFAVLPDTTAVLEYRVRRFEHESDSRDAFSQYALAGVDHSFTERLKGTLRAGAEFRNFEGGNLGTEVSPYGEARVTYLMPRDASLSWSARYGFEVSDTAITEERRTFRTTLAYRQDLTDRIRASLSAAYSHSSYSGGGVSDFSDNVFDISLQLSYALNRNFAITAGYTFTTAESDIFTREYDRNRVNAGIQFAF